MSNITIGKYEAAEANLLEALKLYFEGAHLVPVHTLAAAANEVIEKLAERHSVSMHVLPASRIEKFAKPLRAQAFLILKKPQNFFKHADIIDEDECELNQNHTEFYLFEASRHLCLLNGFNNTNNKPECLMLSAYYVLYFLIAVWPIDKDNSFATLLNVILKKLPIDVQQLPIVNDRAVWGRWYRDNVSRILMLLSEWVSSPEGQSQIIAFFNQPDIQSHLDEVLKQEAERCRKS